MKKLLMMVAMAGAVSAFATAANDPLIPTKVVAGNTYALLCKGERVLTYTAPTTAEVNFEGDAGRSTKESDYSVVLMSTAPAAEPTSEVLSEVEQDGGFSAPGPDSYADGRLVRDGEVYALVWIKEGKKFAGFKVDASIKRVVCVDAENNWFAKVFGTAKDGACTGASKVENPTDDYANGYYQIVLLDTRMPGTDVLAKKEDGLPTFVGAYRVLENGAAAGSTGWQKVKISTDGAVFGFDPTLALAEGYAAVYSSANGEDRWTVCARPNAWAEKQDVNTVFEKADDLTILRQPVVSLTFPKTNEVDYIFHIAKDPEMRALIEKVVANRPLLAALLANADPTPYLGGFTQQELALMNSDLGIWAKAVMPFFAWNADFEVSFDRPVKAGTIVLDGQYDKAAKYGYESWVGSTFPADMVPGQSFRLLKEGYTKPIYVNYSEICTNVIQFKCGAFNLSPENWGTTMTVKLCIYENTGRCHESGSRIEIGTYEYTFCGPLTVKFNKGPTAPEDESLPNSFVTNFDGKAAIKLPVPTYTQAHEELAFVGWSNSVDLVNLVYVPTNTWGELKLWSVWKQAKTVQVEVKKDGEEAPQSANIKVTQEWIDENAAGKDLKTVLNKPVDESKPDGMKVWETYVLGLDPTGKVEVVATEKKSDDTALVVSTVQAPPPDSGFKVTYSLDKIEQDEETVRVKGKEQDTKDIEIPLAVEEGKELPTGYYKMNVFITPVENGEEKTDEKVPVKSETTVGVLTVQTEEKLVPVSVPWTSLAETPNADARILADEIVQPQGLADGDLLHVYNGEAYTTLVLKNGKWTKGNNVIVGEGGSEVLDGEIPSVARGSAMWLERKTNTGKPFHLFGQYNKTEATTKINKPAEGSKKPEYNLIAPTGIEETDINQVINHDIGENDRLMIVDKGAPVYYSYDGTAWGYNRQEIATTKNGKTIVRTVRTTDAKVSAGIGLWYISNGGEPTINWNK